MQASKFWGRSDSEEESSEEEETTTSEEETSSEEESSSDESSSGSSSDDSSKPKKGGASRFLMGSSESESEDERRVVKSAKTKALEELQSTCTELRNKMNINDWSAIQTLFDKLNKQLERVMKTTGALGVPRLYIRLLVELEDFLAKTLAEKPKLSPTNTRALARMKQQLRRHNTGYAEQMAAFRANPVSESEPESEPAESESSEESGSEAGAGTDSDGGKFRLARTGVVERPKDKLLSMDPKEITPEVISKKLRDIAAARGKASRADKRDSVETLEFLASITGVPSLRLRVLVALLTVIFDQNQQAAAPMTAANWARASNVVFDILAVLEENPDIQLVDAPPEEEEAGADGADDFGAADGNAADGNANADVTDAESPKRVWGNLVGFLTRLDDEWTGGLKGLDPHAHEYMLRLRDETVILALAAKVATRAEAAGDGPALATVALRRIDHLYYKTDVVYDAVRKLAAAQKAEAASDAVENGDAKVTDGTDGNADGNDESSEAAPRVRLPADFDLPPSASQGLAELVQCVYRHGTDNQKGAALLSDVYFRAVHDDFYGARDLLLGSRIGEQTSALEARLQVLFNRATAALGLAAFRGGKVTEAHACLGDLYGTGRVKELLAQGVAPHRYAADRTPEQEAAERRRQVPFHMHINLELLESAYLTSAMLLEVPHQAALGGAEARRRVLSKPLRRLLDNYERQTFVGPPENVRDHIVAAVRALAAGDWRRAYAYVSGMACWNLMPGKAAVLARLEQHFKTEGLRTYLLTYARYYSSLSIARLCDMYDLPERKVHAVISRALADGALAGAHDQPTGTIVVTGAEQGALAGLAADLADKASLLVDLNERALALRTGVLTGEEDDGEGGGGRGRSGAAEGPGGYGRRRGGPRLGLPGGEGGRGRGRGGRGGRGGYRSGFIAEPGFGGGVFGRGRSSRVQQRDDSNFKQLGNWYGGRGANAQRA